MKRVLTVLGAVRLVAPVLAPRFFGDQTHPWPIEGRTVFVGDREYLVRETGPEGAPVVVLVHGLGGSGLAEWYEVGPRLAERFRLVLIDHRNHGLSPKTTSRYEIADLADDVSSVLDRLGVSSAHVVGYSMGGAIAQELAHRHPDQVSGLVLVGAFTSHPSAWRAARQAATFAVRAWERTTGIGTPEVRAGYLIGTGAVEPHHARWMWEETHRRDVEGGAAASLALLRFDSTPWVGELDVPALVVVPTRDQLVPPTWQYRLAGLLSRARVVEILGGRHEVPWTHGERLAGLISVFLDEVAETG